MRWLRRRIGTLGRMWSDADFRTLTLLRVFQAGQLHQTTDFTAPDRYPHIFAASQTYLKAFQRPRILSFGCATGEEVLSLRRYFPTARIVGAEINPRSLAHCRALQLDAGVSFIRSTRRGIARSGPFDAIFALAVLQRTPHVLEQQDIRNISGLYPFRRFDRQLAELDRVLAPGGILVIEHACYRLEDTSIAPGYEALPLVFDARVDADQSMTRKFDRHGDLLQGCERPGVIFRKKG